MDSDETLVITGGWRAHLPKLLGLAGLICVAYAGARQLSYWIVPVGGVIFAGAYVIERKALWSYAISTSSVGKLVRQALVTVAIQTVVVGIFYLLFFGLAAIVTGRAGFTAFGLHETGLMLVTAACFIAAAVLKSLFAASSAPDDTLAILEEIDDLASSSIIMPVRIFQLASQIAKQKLGFAIPLIEQCAANEESFHVRRVAYTAVRFMGLRENPLLDVRAFLDRGFADSHPWVRYDAVFAAERLGFEDHALQAKLIEFADGLEPPPEGESIASSDADLQLRVRAARLLRKLEGPAAA
ncbi:hypothetical protein MHY87_05555 [Microvirga sp. ACRRW]|uniref:hypothetical protein n=1 Tax=Microvirga sp. ACRRW TaxID=2918205 RepID=UPI001EF6E535|nr:hypothetical protein [Microvirga sp. ACRRW]MCG7392367.1 hypothetical protein [Microvirga sp. ACRRW]